MLMAPCAEIPMLSTERKVHGCQKSKSLCTREFAVCSGPSHLGHLTRSLYVHPEERLDMSSSTSDKFPISEMSLSSLEGFLALAFVRNLNCSNCTVTEDQCHRYDQIETRRSRYTPADFPHPRMHTSASSYDSTSANSISSS